MKRFALLALLVLVACDRGGITSPETQVNTAALKRSAPTCGVSGWHRINGNDEPLHGNGTRAIWGYTITFYTNCTSDVNLKVYFIQPVISGYSVTDGRQKPVADVDAPVVEAGADHGVLRHATFQMLSPKNRETYPDAWNPKFFVEVRSGGTLIGSFTTVDDGTWD